MNVKPDPEKDAGEKLGLLQSMTGILPQTAVCADFN
jgi:hypothetical protein